MLHPPHAQIPGSYWGAPEAGLIGNQVHVRADTPIHSLLHEACHAICMGAARRQCLHRDAGGDDLEESAVCYLQLCIAASVDAIGIQRLAFDMDEWGYSFRAGTTLAWFDSDACDAKDWLLERPNVTRDLPQGVRMMIGNTPRLIAC
ncbi:MAG: hypothetical protein AAF004_05370 [Pseudomonadota bacterium]